MMGVIVAMDAEPDNFSPQPPRPTPDSPRSKSDVRVGASSARRSRRASARSDVLIVRVAQTIRARGATQGSTAGRLADDRPCVVTPDQVRGPFPTRRRSAGHSLAAGRVEETVSNSVILQAIEPLTRSPEEER